MEDTTNIEHRPGYATNLKPITVFTNYFEITFSPMKIGKFSVSINPPVAARRQKKRIFEILLDHQFFKGRLAGIATDYASQIVSTYNLVGAGSEPEYKFLYYEADSPKPAEKKSDKEKGPKEYTVTLTKLDEWVDGPQIVANLNNTKEHNPPANADPILSAFNLILAKSASSRNDGVSIRGGKEGSAGGFKHFNWSVQGAVPLGGGLDAMVGFFTSIRMVSGKLAVNMNATTGVFLPPNISVAQFILDNNPHISLFKKKGLRVTFNYLKTGKKTKTVYALEYRTASQLSFDFTLPNNTVRKVTVVEYFKRGMLCPAVSGLSKLLIFCARTRRHRRS